jgi:hypothetical protein
MVDAVLVSQTPPPASTRVGAIVQTSVYDAVNGIARRYTQFHPEVLGTPAPRRASAQAAGAGAAYTALVALFPALKATFDARLEETLARISHETMMTMTTTALGADLRGGGPSRRRFSRGETRTGSMSSRRRTRSARFRSGSRRRRPSCFRSLVSSRP